MEKRTGQKLWMKAKSIIPSGNQLLSKRSERFLPLNWPSYYQKAKGCKIWDLDGNEYFDFAQMGVGSCILGYANDEIVAAVNDSITKGSMSSLNSFEEVSLAERLIQLHPWADMVRFARTGGEACMIAIRIARAAVGKSKIAFCGYHGWHDWYISANINDDTNLDNQLLRGLKPNGIPNELKKTAIPFMYNDIKSLENIISEYADIGVIIMEPRRNAKPQNQFLNNIRDIANKIGAILVFDEVTSGFRINNGGIHLTQGVTPDIAVFGKALGNGHPISAIIGKREVMEAAKSSFISSTFWTERIGFVAALKTLEIIERDRVYLDLISYGNKINTKLKNAANNNKLKMTLSGISPLTHISFEHNDASVIQTYYAQEMLKLGYLLGSSIYSTIAYDDKIIDSFGNSTNNVFCKINHHMEMGALRDKLEGPIIESGFKRLN
jgi:glutamate-1-semialdehyde 2,1-aminomutase